MKSRPILSVFFAFLFLLCTASSCIKESPIDQNPRFNHVVLYVTDMDRSVNFYSDALGLEVHKQINELILIDDESERRDTVSVNMRLMRLPGSKFIYELIEYPNVPDVPPAHIHFQHVGIEVTDIEESLDRAVRNGAMEAMPIRTIEAGDIVAKAVSFKGPDGEQIELMQIISGDY